MSKRRQLYCDNCYDQTEHSVLRSSVYSDDDDEHRVRASTICAKCKNEQVIDISVADWNALMKNKEWEVS